MFKETDSQGNELTREQAQTFLAGVTHKMVLKVYSGRLGCMCGCRGKWRWNPSQRSGEQDAIYNLDDNDYSARSVSIIFNKIKSDPRTRVQDGNILFLCDETRNRGLAVYLAD